MKLTPEQQAALRRAVESYELPENYGQEWTAFMFAAAIAQERARCAKVCRDHADGLSWVSAAICNDIADAIESPTEGTV